jgi:hypothetical protein
MEQIAKITVYLIGPIFIIAGFRDLHLYSQGKGLHYVKNKTKGLFGSTPLKPIPNYLSKNTAKQRDRRVLLIESLAVILFGILWLYFGREILFSSTF